MTAYAPCGGSKLPRSSIAVDTTPSWHIAEHINDRLKIASQNLLPYLIRCFSLLYCL